MSRIRANTLTNQNANGAPNFPNGVTVTGIATATNVSVAQSVTATTYYGSGSNLTGIDATTIQTGTTKVVTSSTLISNQISGAGIATVQAGGIDVTGIVTATSYRGDASQLTGIPAGVGGATGVDFNDNVKVRLGTGNDLELYHNGTDSYISNGTSKLRIGNSHNDGIKFFTNNSTRWNIEGSGHIIPDANNTYDIGSSSYRIRNLYVDDMHFSNEGSSNSVDGTWGDWTLQEGKDTIFMLNNRTNKKYKMNLTEVD